MWRGCSDAELLFYICKNNKKSQWNWSRQSSFKGVHKMRLSLFLTASIFEKSEMPAFAVFSILNSAS